MSHSWTRPQWLEIDSYTGKAGKRIFRYTYGDDSILLSIESHKRPQSGSRRYYIKYPEKFPGLLLSTLDWPREVKQEFIQQFWQRCGNLQKYQRSQRSYSHV